MAHLNIDERRKAVSLIKRKATKEALLEIAKQFNCSYSTVCEDLRFSKGERPKNYYTREKKKDTQFEKIKSTIHERDGKKCQYCGAIRANNYIIEHVIPSKSGGLSVPENLVVSCSGCNVSKGSKIWVPNNFMQISKDNIDHQNFVISNAAKDYR